MRECTEWVRYCWSNADKTTVKRILLIGDSITEGMYNHFKKIVKENYSVDILASSRSLDDKYYEKELQHILNDYRYDIVYYNNGLHGSHLNINNFEKRFDECINELLGYTKKLIIATSTPVTKRDNPSVLNEEANKIVVERNIIIKKLANKYGLILNELYDEMINHPEYKLDDGLHYNDFGKKAQAEILANIVQPK